MDTKEDAIVFLDPPQRGGKLQLGAEIVQQYYDKLRCFQTFVPYFIKAGGDMAVFAVPGGEAITMTVEEYNREKLWRGTLKNETYLFEKPKDLGVAYLWEAETKRLKGDKLDDQDRAFLKGPDTCEGATKHKLYGYHTYGGYYGFFRPDLNEVIHLVATVVPPEKLDGVKCIYVTTDMYPSAHVGQCYDVKKDMHRALTTCYVIH